MDRADRNYNYWVNNLIRDNRPVSLIGGDHGDSVSNAAGKVG